MENVYEHFGDRLDLRGQLLRKGDTITLDEAEAAALMENDVPIRLAKAAEPVAPAEVKE